ncbi:MAG: efflux RND transporter periplasmic adaptor subunit, partial [Lachnospiraceae bacterium]|nr:efflux RND transporter periplasmic adaptor subunit [Lachnospiraceae bacterium]
MKKKIKIIITIIVLLAIAGGLTAYLFLKDKNDDESVELVYVDSVENIMGIGVSVESRYMGIVETQETKNVNPDSDKKVKQLYVSAGDSVKKGDVLFEYDTEEMELKLRQLQLELQNINNGITTTNTQIAELVKERDAAPAENKIEYTAQIQNLQAQVNQSNYDASSKQLEIDRQQAAMENNKVTSPMDGVIKEINESVAENGGSF